MAKKNEVTDPKGGTHKFVPNPILNAEAWQEEYPPIITDAKYLRSVHTGEIFPNTPLLARRSDTLEPWFGNPEDYPDGTAPSILTKPTSNVAATALGMVDTLEEL